MYKTNLNNSFVLEQPSVDRDVGQDVDETILDRSLWVEEMSYIIGKDDPENR
jgi:hypothetical protein